MVTLTILLPKTVFAGQEIDETLKSQCKYILYGNLQGTHNDQAEGYLLGFVQGLEYMTAKEELTEFFTSRNYRMIIERACQNALKHPTKKVFRKIISLKRLNSYLQKVKCCNVCKKSMNYSSPGH